MAKDGMWTMTDDGEFILMEPYKTMLFEAKITATHGWVQAMLGYLVEHCDYTAEELKDSLLERNREGNSPMETVDEFVLEALGGDL